ncbi:MAG: VWA domain-containing protein, partial [Actinomycetota bacterium]|nr:VWA domain-containing protein [Actinomycetota bacterium]
RGAGLGSSAPRVARWLGDIRSYFPAPVVRVMQRDAIERLDLDRLLLEPEVLESITPDVQLLSTVLALKDVLPERSRDTARRVVRAVVEDLQQRLAQHARQAVGGALDRATRTTRPRPRDIDWDRTIRANLRHYQPELGTIVPERLIGHGRRRRALQRELVLCIDQSGSMASSVVYASVLGAALASLPSLATHLVAFDTEVVDLSEDLSDPVDVLFGIQLGGGTDIDRALAYCETLVTRPRDTILVLVTDLYEGGDAQSMLRRAASLVRAGVNLIVLLALSDDGAPGYDHDMARTVAGLGAPVFACTPELFGELMAAAIERQDLAQWAASHEIAVERAA